SSQKDSEKAYIAKEKRSLRENPNEELAELAKIYEDKGVSPATAKLVAAELSANDPIKAHLDAEFNLDEDDLNSPAQAGIASLIAFSVGGVIPLIAVLAAPAELRFFITFVAVIIALAITGYLSAHVGGAPKSKAMIRVIVGGALAMVVTYAVGSLFGAAL
ncbi:MAG: VIT1/CCC1 transporter family protein, partial [Candidatus Saccharimonadales bacterium]